MLKLYMYGYSNHIRSSRRLQKEAARNVEVMWLLKKIVPDFRCIADFRKDNAKAIKEVFRAFVKLCNGAGLLSHDCEVNRKRGCAYLLLSYSDCRIISKIGGVGIYGSLL
jgi:transposase